MNNREIFFDKLVSYVKKCIPPRLKRYIRKHSSILILHHLKRFSSKKHFLDIEISNCNLKCAMCPRGGVDGLKNDRKGMMDFELFKKIIDKIVAEKIRFAELWFGSWGEPLLNPFLPEMARYAKYKLPDTTILTFTNLTCLKDPAAIIDSGLDVIRISISGMTQDVYSKNHIGGDINLVLSNLKQLIYFRKQLNRNIKLILVFHDYLYNKKDADLAKKFCEDNGIEFELHRCYIPCVESNIKFHKNKKELAKFYGQFIDLEREELLMRMLNDYRVCNMLNNWVAIDFDGRLYRCCSAYEEKYLLGSFFDYKIREIHALRSNICELCAKTPINRR
jgi:MoaA/NifB/PqqE/SkfB family radical SAM enzyme